MSGKNHNRRSVFGQIQYTKPPEHLGPLKSYYSTVGSSSGFNAKLQLDWSNFDLLELMPVENISHFLVAWIMTMVASH